MDSNKKAVFKTLLYSDIFDYPLTEKEVFFFLHDKKLSVQTVRQTLESLSSIVTKDGYSVLAGREVLLTLRKKREQVSKRKKELALRVSTLLFLFPSVYTIGVSGGVSMENAEKDDDIDLFVITAKGTLWTTRLFMLLFLQVLGKRRRREERNVNNTICLNMFLDEEHLSFTEARKDIYTAHEIVQLLPFYDRNETYKRFLNKNDWVYRLLPNARHIYRQPKTRTFSRFDYIILRLFVLFEPVTRVLQRWYLSQHQTTEEVSRGVAAFHPSDHKEKTLQGYKERCKTYGV